MNRMARRALRLDSIRWSLLLCLSLVVVACSGDGSSGVASSEPGDGSSPSVTASDTVKVVSLHHDASLGPLFAPYIEDFNEKYDGIEVVTDYVPQDYAAVTQTQFAGGAETFDILFSDPGFAQAWYDAGWVRSLDDFPGVDEILDSMLPGIEESLRASDGSLIALPYFQGVELFVYNQAHLDAIGAAVPTTWDEVLEVSRRLKAEGVAETPYSPFWSRDFDIITFAFWAEALSDGAELFDEDMAPIFRDDPAVRSLLERWKVFYEEELVAADIFTTTYGDLVNIFGGGQSTFTVQSGPAGLGWFDPEQSTVAEDARVGIIPGETHETLRWQSTWMMASSSEYPDAAWELMKYLAYQDNEGAFHVPTNLISIDIGMVAPYPEVNAHPDVEASVAGWADPEILSAQFGMTRTLGTVPNQSWWPEFQSELGAILQDIIRGEVTIEEGLQTAAGIVDANR